MKWGDGVEEYVLTLGGLIIRAARCITEHVNVR